MSRLIQLRGVTESTRLGPLSGEIKTEEILHLVGPSGAGKSTLLTRMAGLTDGEGSITFGDMSLGEWPAARPVQYRVYFAQQQSPSFAMSVWHFLMLHQPNKVRTDLLQETADTLGLGGKLGHSMNQLSGGEWRRVCLAAVILQICPQANPLGQLLLLDEPMNSLDVA